jgi:hypothetical protein
MLAGCIVQRAKRRALTHFGLRDLWIKKEYRGKKWSSLSHILLDNVT